MDYETLINKIANLKKYTQKIFIYGYGSYGRNLHHILRERGITTDGFVVTKCTSEESNQVNNVSEAHAYFRENCGFIIAMNEKSSMEVSKYLKDNGVTNKYIIDAGQYIMGGGHKRGVANGSYEVVTVIGCPINCKFCPQSKFVSEYYKDNHNRIKVMNIETLKYSLKFFPIDYDISFGGMSEPFYNKEFMDMLELACASGRNVSLYTTLVGMNKNDIFRLTSMPISNVVLHVADKMGYSNIPLTEEYFEILESLIHSRKRDGTPFINMCNSQTEPHKRVKDICKGKYEILTEMTNRAGNLKDKNLICNQIPTGKIDCWNIGDDYVNCVLLPDGTVLLCCMDWGMKHVIGNMYTNSYEEIMQGNEMLNIRKGMNGDTNIDILCRKCSYARAV